MSVRMTLEYLLQGVAEVGSAAGIAVSSLSLDSRQIEVGGAFVALRGLNHHGIEFAPAALARGAVVVLAEAPADGLPLPAGVVVWIEHLRERLGEIATRFFGYPGTGMQVTGVTGTNGKTSIVQLLTGAWSQLGHRAASIGTLGAGLHGALDHGERTTPDVISVHRLLARFRDAGASRVQMEVSSHALVQDRVNAVPFAVAVFSNLSRDHLDYHGNMQAYGEAKARLFAWPGLRAAVINLDDAFGRQLAAHVPDGLECLRYGIDSAAADVRACNIHSHDDGVDFDLLTPWGEGSLHSRLLGRFNVANLLAVAACLGASAVSFDAIRRALSTLDPVPGRMSRLGGGDAVPLVVVDYAHTPDALEQTLASLRRHTRGRLLCVFGAGGERDAGKRPLMGAAVEAGADTLIITDDNPRGEDGDAIVADIRSGLRTPAAATVQRNRAQAIADAIQAARPGDVVLIAGKGHETTQEDARGRHPFDDLAVARRVLGEQSSC